MPAARNEAIEVGNQSVWNHNRLKLQAMESLVATKYLSLMIFRSTHFPNSAINKTPTVHERGTFVVHRLAVTYKRIWGEPWLVPIGDPRVEL